MLLTHILLLMGLAVPPAWCQGRAILHGKIINELPTGSTPTSSGHAQGTCKTANGERGRCQDLSSCPYVLLDLMNIRRYLCFRNYFFPGICCPIPGGDNLSQGSTDSEVTDTKILVGSHKTTTTHSTTKRTTIRSTTRAPTTSPLTTTKATTTTTRRTNTTTTKKPAPRDGCGKNNVVLTRVVGGVKAVPGQWPWMVSIFLNRGKGKEFWCGGTLINQRYVLTAAHCVHDSRQRRYRSSQFTVRFADIDLHSKEDDVDVPTEDFNVQEIKVHPNFRLRDYYNDICLLKLSKSVTYSDYIRPICLPDRRLGDDNMMGTFGTVAGWGASYFGGSESGVLSQVEVPIWDNADCDRVYKQSIEKIYICAGLADGGKDACQGDSGSPLMLSVNGRWTQIGIVSFGTKCAEPGFPGVYTRLTEFLDWTEKNSL